MANGRPFRTAPNPNLGGTAGAAAGRVFAELVMRRRQEEARRQAQEVLDALEAGRAGTFVSPGARARAAESREELGAQAAQNPILRALTSPLRALLPSNIAALQTPIPEQLRGPIRTEEEAGTALAGIRGLAPADRQAFAARIAKSQQDRVTINLSDVLSGITGIPQSAIKKEGRQGLELMTGLMALMAKSGKNVVTAKIRRDTPQGTKEDIIALNPMTGEEVRRHRGGAAFSPEDATVFTYTFDKDGRTKQVTYGTGVGPTGITKIMGTTAEKTAAMQKKRIGQARLRLKQVLSGLSRARASALEPRPKGRTGRVIRNILSAGDQASELLGQFNIKTPNAREFAARNATFRRLVQTANLNAEQQVQLLNIANMVAFLQNPLDDEINRTQLARTIEQIEPVFQGLGTAAVASVDELARIFISDFNIMAQDAGLNPFGEGDFPPNFNIPLEGEGFAAAPADAGVTILRVDPVTGEVVEDQPGGSQ